MLRTTLIVAASILLASPVGYCDVIEVALPGLAGSYVAGGDRTAEFDLGQELDSVHAVSISWQGSISPGLGHGDGVWIPEDEWFEWSAEFMASMDPDPPQNGFWYAWVGPVDGSFDEVTPFDSFGSAGWEFLLDGVGQIEVELAPAISIGGVMVTPPSGHISTATLLIDADLTSVESASWSNIKALFR